MKVVIAIDSFKGSLSSLEAGECVKEAIKEFVDEIDVVLISDGGEGSIDAMKFATGAKNKSIKTYDPLGRAMISNYGLINDLAIMDMASTCGLTLLKDSEKNPLFTSTFGLGEMIKDALINENVKEFIVGIGGSSTNDAGIGMLSALGYEFKDDRDEILEPIGKNLIKISKIVKKEEIKELSSAKFIIACDVNNPLFGKNGASFIYAGQKGANENDIIFLDNGLRHFAKVTKEFNGNDFANLAGSGAAGGLGFGFISFLNAKLQSGFKIISDLANLEEKIKEADLIITGEGSLDEQSFMGKVPIEVAKIAKKHKKRVISFSGSLKNDDFILNKEIDACFCIMQSPMDLKSALDKKIAYKNLFHSANQVIRLLKI